MLAVTSNWLLSDGSLLPTRAAAATGWLAALRRAAVRAGWGRDGRYQPVESIGLVLAGDTLELLVSDVWSGKERPWQAGRRADAARARSLAAAIRAARPALQTLRRWRRQGLPVPAAAAHGRPSLQRAGRLRLDIILLAGDRDAWLGEAAGEASRLGIAVGEEWSAGEISIRHGHDLDPLCHGGMAAGLPRPPTLAESIAVDLVVPFAIAMREDRLAWPALRASLPTIAAASPAALPGMVGRVPKAWAAGSRPARQFLAIWGRSVAGWWAAARRETPSSGTAHDVVDALAGWLERAAFGEAGQPPAAVAALERLAPRPSASGRLVLGHLPPSPGVTGLEAAGGPHLAVVHRPGGPGWREPLGGPVACPAVVAIGGQPAGPAIVDAA
jgi:hypothetical protein